MRSPEELTQEIIYTISWLSLSFIHLRKAFLLSFSELSHYNFSLCKYKNEMQLLPTKHCRSKASGSVDDSKTARLECQISFTMYSLHITLKGIGLGSLD